MGGGFPGDESFETDSFRRLAAYFDEAPTPAYLWRLEGDDLYLRRLNKAAVRRFGEDAPNLLGARAGDFLADRPDIVADIRACLSTQATVTRETYVETDRLGERRIVTTYVPLAADTVVGHAEDISELLEVTLREQRATERLARYFDRAPIPAYLWRERDGHAVLEGANLAGVEFTRGGASQAVGTTAEELYPERPDLVEDLRRALGGESFTREMSYAMKSRGESLDLVVTYVHIPPDSVVVHTRDVTEQRGVEAELRKSHEAARGVLDASTQPILLCDTEGVVLEANQTACGSFGISRDQLLGRSMFELFPPDVAAGRRAFVEEVVRTGTPIVREDRDGDRYYRARLYPLSDDGGEVGRVVIYAEDVTEERQARDALLQSRESLRALMQHLESVRERERAQAARDLHDELGSVLTALKIDVEELLSVQQCEIMGERLDAMAQLLDQAIEIGRRVTVRLRPGVLDDLGLAAAAEWLGEDLERRTGVRCVVNAPQGDLEIPKPVATAMFRILQEALTNVSRHAEAKSVGIDLAVDGDHVALVVADDGTGFDPADSEGDTFGLLGMRERVRTLGGTLDITSSPGAGTEVRVTLPGARSAERS